MTRRNAGLFAVSMAMLVSMLAAGTTDPPASARTSSHLHVGSLPSGGEVGAIQASIRAGHAFADPTGNRGAGGRGVGHSKGKRVASAFEPSAQLFHTGFIAVEPTLGVGPIGDVFVHAVSARSDLNGFPLGGLTIRSHDEGATWGDVSPKIAGVPTHQYTQDPYLYVDPTTGRVFMSDLLGPHPCQVVSFTDDSGASWTDALQACEEVDHQTIFAGPPVNSPTSGYPNVVYNCAVNGGVGITASTVATCLKSLDGGRTFLLTGAPPFHDGDAASGTGFLGAPYKCDGTTGHGFVGPDGAVYLPKGWCGKPWLAISPDEGKTWTRVQVSDLPMARDELGDPDHEAAVVADANNIYYAWVADDRIPYLAVSRDGGQTWGAPLRVAPPEVKEANLPAMAIGADGRLAIAYMGSTNSAGAPFPEGVCRLTEEPHTWILGWTVSSGCPEWDTKAADLSVTWNGYITVTADATAEAPIFHTVSANDPTDPLIKGRCGPWRCQAVYDFIDVAVAPDGTPWAVFVDACVPGHDCTAMGEGVVGHMVGGPPLR